MGERNKSSHSKGISVRVSGSYSQRKAVSEAGNLAPALFTAHQRRKGREKRRVRRCYTRSPGRAGQMGGSGLDPAPTRLSARGAGPDVTLVRAAAHGLPDALSPALRGRGARGAAAAAGRGVGRDSTASGARARGRGPRSAFCSSAAVYVLKKSLFPFFFLPCNFEHFARLSVGGR